MISDTEFENWMKRVDDWLFKHLGLSNQDLPDIAYRDLYESGVSPSVAAKEAVQNAKEC